MASRSFLLAVIAGALLGCGDDSDSRELPLCAREPMTKSGEGMQLICGFAGTADGWTIAGEGPLFDSQRTLVAMDYALPGKSYRAECQRRNRSERIDQEFVWAQLVAAPGLYCKVPVLGI